jgi:hypothetical protein
MFFSKIAASVAALAVAASAAPLARLVPRAPETSTGTTFRLVVKITDGTDFTDSPVNNGEVTLYHTVASVNRAVITNSGAVFYQNGTQTERDGWAAQLINYTPSFPQGFSIDFEDGTDTFKTYVNAGPGLPGVMVSSDAKPLAFIDRHGASADGTTTGTFVVCQDTSLGNVLSWKVTNGASEGCVAVDLVPECDALPGLSDTADWIHGFVENVRCYADVSAITEWAA